MYASSEATKDSLFLAGGITDCPEWQSQMVELLRVSALDKEIAVLNPRRSNFPKDNPDAVMEQIRWEHQALRDAEAISFWFCKETLCSIVLYELGAWSMTAKPIFVGMDPEYVRRQDVEIQTSLARLDVNIVYSLPDLVSQVVKYFK